MRLMQSIQLGLFYLRGIKRFIRAMYCIKLNLCIIIDNQVNFAMNMNFTLMSPYYNTIRAFFFLSLYLSGYRVYEIGFPV